MLRKAGFGLVELIVVLVLVGILAFVFLPKTSPLYDIRLGTAAEKIAADIYYTQQLAMATQVATGIKFSHSQYTVYKNISSLQKAKDPLTGKVQTKHPHHPPYHHGHSALQKAKDPLTGKDFVINLDQGDYAGVTISSWTFAGNGLKFDSSGKPYDLNGNPLTTDGLLTVSGGGMSKTVVVKPGTGKVFVQ